MDIQGKRPQQENKIMTTMDQKRPGWNMLRLTCAVAIAEVGALAEAVRDSGMTIRMADVKTGTPVYGKDSKVVIPAVLIVSHTSPPAK
jgi:hypothetical protein